MRLYPGNAVLANGKEAKVTTVSENIVLTNRSGKPRIEGILLTDEILERLGIIYDENSEELSHKDGTYLSLEIDDENKYRVFFWNTSIKIVRYVHEVQNLFAEFENIELEYE